MSEGEVESAPLDEQPVRSRRAELVETALRRPRKAAGATVLVISAILFAVAWRDLGVEELLVIVGVLLVHEGGHLVCMRWFGFRDLGMFFLPFFGAAATGHKPGASVVAHSVVSLAGPVPGLLLALPLLFFIDSGTGMSADMPLVAHVATILVFLNLFNLLPVTPLDGGRFFEVLVFSRWPLLDGLFRLAAVAALGWAAFHGMPLLGVIAAVMLLSMGVHMRVAFAAAALRRDRQLSTNVDELDDEDLKALHDAAEGALPAALDKDRDKHIAGIVTQLFDRAARAPAGVLVTVGLVLVWLLAVALGLCELIYLAVDLNRG